LQVSLGFALPLTSLSLTLLFRAGDQPTVFRVLVNSLFSKFLSDFFAAFSATFVTRFQTVGWSPDRFSRGGYFSVLFASVNHFFEVFYRFSFAIGGDLFASATHFREGRASYQACSPSQPSFWSFFDSETWLTEGFSVSPSCPLRFLEGVCKLSGLLIPSTQFFEVFSTSSTEPIGFP